MEDQAMSTIVIKDLPESVDLDRQAMRTVIGGARTAGRQSSVGQIGQAAIGRSVLGGESILNYRHFTRKAVSAQPGTSKHK
jgi:hypothetical protein